MLAYTTATRDQGHGWDAFDSMVLWAVSQRAAFGGITQLLPDGIAFHLIHRALELAVADGLLFKVVADDGVRYQLTPAGHSRLATTARPGHQAAA